MASSDYYFFTDTNLLVTQLPAGAFGPIAKINSTDPDEYRVTSLHTATANPTAYAACDAIVCVQRIPSTSLVNIILKPLVQPALNFAPVKYIIYKGILANSLIDINGTDVAPLGNNDLTKFLWAEQAKKNASVTPNTTATAPAKALGIDLTSTTFANSDLIDNLFYRAGVAFQLPVVKGGWSLGQFDKTSFGMEVLMEGLNFNHSLLLARQLENKVSVPALAGGANAAQTFDHWHTKEQVLGYMDPCAFYGSFFRVGVQAKTSGSSTFAPKTGNPLYQDLLLSFANRNTAYLDIRNEHNFSLNYFKNYGNFLKLGSGGPVDYYASKWPILTLTATDFATNTTTARNAFSIQLPVGDNPQPLIYVSQGYRDINAKGSEFPAELSNAERFFDTFEAPVSGYTATKSTSALNSLALVVPNISGQAATTPVSCYTRLKYFKQQQDATTLSTVIKSENYLDNLVYPIDFQVLFGGTANITSSVYDEEIYVNARNVPGLRFGAVGKLGIARDTANTSFFIIPTVVRTNEGQASSLITLSGETSDSSETFASLIASKYPLGRVRKSDLTLSATALAPIAEFVSDADISALSKFDAPDFSKFLIFVVSNSTYDAWKSRISSTGGDLNNRFRVYLGVKNLQTQTDTGGIPYLSFELVLRGFALDTTGNNYEVRETGTDFADSAANITVYASAPAPATCSITSDADGMSTDCIPVGGLIQLKAVPSSGSGTYQWSTSSTKIMLSNTATQMVTVQAKNNLSASRGAETVQLVFTPTGGTALAPITRSVTVISVKFSKSDNQSYGYDDMDNDLGVPHHVSVKRLGFTKVKVDIDGGGTTDDLEFVSDDITIAEAVAPSSGTGTSFDLTIEGKNQVKAETSIKAVCKGGPVCAMIKINVYQQVAIKAIVAKVFDKASTNTALQHDRFDVAAAAARINSTYKSLVVKFDLVDADLTCDAINVPYDISGNGNLTLGAGVVGPELDEIKKIDAIKNAIAAGTFYIILVKDVDYIFYLAAPAAPPDKTIILASGHNVSLFQIKDNTTYNLGLGAAAEQVTIVSHDFIHGVDLNGDGAVDGYVFTLSAQLTKPHLVTDGIVRPIGGVTGSPGDPIVVLETTVDTAGLKQTRTEELIGWIIGHELGHRAFEFANVIDATNLMNGDANFTDHKLRFKNLLDYDHPNKTENQWEKVQR
jgi:hypothetical protein